LFVTPLEVLKDHLFIWAAIRKPAQDLLTIASSSLIKMSKLRFPASTSTSCESNQSDDSFDEAAEQEKETSTLIARNEKILPHTPRPHHRGRRVVVYTAFILFSTLLAVTAIYMKWSHDRRYSWVPCGATAAEARSNNCHYVPMLRAWVPDACYFPEPDSEYDIFHDRPWFEDWNMTRPADMQKVITGVENYEIFASRFHNDHCLYVWRKLSIAVERGLPLLDEKSADRVHADHCAMMMTKTFDSIWNRTWEEDFANKKTHAPLGFLSCVRIR